MAAPVQVCVTSSSELVANALYAVVDAAIAKLPTSCCVLSKGRVILGALTECDLESAIASARACVPDLRTGPIGVTYLDSPCEQEPFYRVVVTSPEDCWGDVIGDLNRRTGAIEAVNSLDGSLVLKCSIPIATMIGYDLALSTITRGRGTAKYAFIGYFPRTRKPEPPLPPAVAARA
jgi:Elongation factor G C-terminus